jgi:hypothetical protein
VKIIVSDQVHYVSHGTPVRPDGTQAYQSVCRAAMVTEVGEANFGEHPEEVGLCVINPTGLFFRSISDGGNPHDASAGIPGSWHTLLECHQARDIRGMEGTR